MQHLALWILTSSCKFITWRTEAALPTSYGWIDHANMKVVERIGKFDRKG